MFDEKAFFKTALRYFSRGDYPRAAATCRHGLVSHEDCGRLWELLGMSCWLTGDRHDAIRALERASLHVALVPCSQIALASSYLSAGKAGLARVIYLHLTTLGELPAAILPHLAAGLGRVKEYQAALEVCERIVKGRPDDPAAWFGIAYYGERLGRPAEDVIAAMRTAARLDPGSLTYRVNLAACLVRAGEVDEAYRHVRDIPIASLGRPHLVRSLLPAFHAAGEEGRVSECLSLLRRAGANRPDPR